MSRNKTNTADHSRLIIALGWVIVCESVIITFGEGPCKTDKLKFART